jgi:hypothetical protein
MNSPLPVVLESHEAATTHYLYGLDLLAERIGADWLYYHSDELGSTCSLTDGIIKMSPNYALYLLDKEGYHSACRSSTSWRKADTMEACGYPARAYIPWISAQTCEALQPRRVTVAS